MPRQIIGSRIQCYTVKNLIGEGGTSKVYLAEADDGKKVAIKILKREGEGAEKRFKREIELAQKLKHDYIVETYGSGEYYKNNYIIMEYIEGKTLDEIIRDERCSIHESLGIVSKIASAMDYAHSRGIIHRDIKPGNIMLTKDNQPKIADFGLARSIFDPEKFTAENAIAGTLSYMAPEQIAKKEPDARTDVYSLGVVLYELLARVKPFTGDNFMHIARNIMEQRPLEPSKINSSLNKQLDSICLKAISKNPELRYKNMNQFAETISRYLTELSSFSNDTTNGRRINEEIARGLGTPESGNTLDEPLPPEFYAKLFGPSVPVLPSKKQIWKNLILGGVVGAGLLLFAAISVVAVKGYANTFWSASTKQAGERKEYSVEQLLKGMKEEYFVPECKETFGIESARGKTEFKVSDEFRRGVGYAKKDDFDAALLVFDRILQYGLNNPREMSGSLDFEQSALINMGIICMETGRYDEALKFLNRDSLHSIKNPSLSEKRDYVLFVANLLGGHKDDAFACIDRLWVQYDRELYLGLLKRHFPEKIFQDTTQNYLK